MADTRYLKRRRQGWYSQVPIPRDLRDQLGSSPVVRSLQTRDLTVAQRRRWDHVTAAKDEFDRVRRAGGGAPLAPVEIEERAWEAYERTLQQAEEDDLDEDGIDIWIGQLAEDIEGGKLSELEEAEAWARVAALNGRCCALHDRLYEPPRYFGRRGGRIDRVTLRPRVVTPTTRAARDATHASMTGPGAPTTVMSFTEAAKLHLEEAMRDPDARLTAQTVAQAAAVHRLFADYCRDRPLSEISRAMASKFLDAVSALDPHWGRSPAAHGLTLQELLKGAGGSGPRLSNRTLNRYSNTLGAVYKWAKRRGHYDGSNPFEGQTRRQASQRETGYSPFTPAELVKLLTATVPVVAPVKHTVTTALDWITWIAAYSGMRLNEVCSLSVADLMEEDGVRFFNVTNAKTAAGDRRVPVHSILDELGLLEYRRRLAARGRMWPALRPGGPDGKLSLYVTKLFTRRRRDLGLTRNRLAFHSLRGNVATALERAGVLENEAVELLGHKKLSMSYGVYSAGLDLRGLQRVVEEIKYSGVLLPARKSE